MTTLLKERKTGWAMGIISKIPLKDFKSKLLGGKYRKVEPDVPAIDVTPPTPISRTYTFSGPSETSFETVREEENTGLQRCNSVPDLIGTTYIETSKDVPIQGAKGNSLLAGINSGNYEVGLSQSLPTVGSDNFLQIPKKRRKRRKSKRGSQQNFLDDFNTKWLKDNGLIDSNATEFSSKDGYQLENNKDSRCAVDNKNGGNDINRSADINQNMRHLDQSCDLEIVGESSGSKEENKSEGEHSLTSFSDDSEKCEIGVVENNLDDCLGREQPDKQTQPFNETGRLPNETESENLIIDKIHDTHIKTEDENVTISNISSLSLEQESMPSVKNVTEENFLNNEEFHQDTSSSAESAENLLDIDVNELSCNSEKDKDTQISTWSLNLDSKSVVATFKRGHQRTQSDTNFLTETQKENRPTGFDDKAGMVATRSLDLDAVTSSEDITGREVERTKSDTTLQRHLPKHDKNYYMGRLNGIISKFSTWSLDMELIRKRSMDHLVVERAFSETTLGPEHERARRCWSYHTLLCDEDFASRYQIYLPTVEDIAEQAGADDSNSTENKHGTAVTKKQYIHKNSMKELKRQCSEQIGHMYENGMNIYKNRAAYITAFKERTRTGSLKETVKTDPDTEKPVFTPRKAITLPRGNQK